MKHENQKFENKEVRLDGNQYYNCEFVNCFITFAGGTPPALIGCGFIDCEFGFKGAGERTLKFLDAIYHGFGDFGKTLVEGTFQNIRENKYNFQEPSQKKD
ncbi:MAG: hypothetical protein NW226_08370 [Microscillaceae bacterium]|nr:hypothetical protein [Microscillaceae bacterium]